MADNDYPILSFDTVEGTTVQLLVDENNNLYHKRTEKNGKTSGWKSASRDISDFRSGLLNSDLSTEFMERGVNVKWFGAKGDGVTDDTEAIQDAIDYGSSTVFFPTGKYLVSSTITSEGESIDLEGSVSSKIITETPGLDYMMKLSNKSVSVRGLSFDSQNIGRGHLVVDNSSRLLIDSCEFTGYTADNGYYKTDSCCLLNNVVSTTILNCRYHDTGYSYGTATGTLNRCVTSQGDLSESLSIRGTTFERCNQAVVATGALLKLMISESVFDHVRDNSLYLLGIPLAVVSDTKFFEKYDESSVVYGGKFIYRDCVFADVPNKVFSINGATELLSVTGCSIINSDGYNGSPISYRSPATDHVSTIIFEDNYLELPTDGTSTSDIFIFGSFDILKFNGNIMRVGTLLDYQRVLSFRSTNTYSPAGSISRNISTPLSTSNTHSTSSMFIERLPDTSTITIDSNEFKGRFSINTKGSYRGHRVIHNVGPYGYGLSNKSDYLDTSMPTTGSNWKIGDIVWNSAPTASNPVAYWLRVTTGSGNVLGTDWIAK